MKNKLSHKIPKAIKVALALSLAVYLCSLFQEGIEYLNVTSEGLENKYLSSIELLLSGGFVVLGGGLLEFIVWLANPFYYYSIYLLISGKGDAIEFTTFSSLLALSFRAWTEILVSESGSNAEIVSFELGYYLWVASFVMLSIGVLAGYRKITPPNVLV